VIEFAPFFGLCRADSIEIADDGLDFEIEILDRLYAVAIEAETTGRLRNAL